MKEVILKRHLISNLGVLGYLFFNNKRICTTLENPWRNNEPMMSCIPEGEFICTADYTGKFRWWRIDCVIDREGIEIHEGNKVDDTQGCILIGKLDSETMDKGRLWIRESKKTLNMLKNTLPNEFKLIITS